MIRCPINFYTDNLVFNQDRSCWAVFKLSGYNFDFLGSESKINLLYKMARMLSGIMSEAKILIIPVMQDMNQHFRNLKENLNKEDVLYESAVDQLDKTYEYLQNIVREENGAVNDYQTYLMVKLQDSTEFDGIVKIKEMYDFFIKNPINAIEVFMGSNTKDILQQKIDKFIRLSEKWFYKQNQRIRMQKVDEAEIQWLIRRMAFRGMNKNIKLFYKDSKKTKVWKPLSRQVKVGNESVVRPYQKDIVGLFSGTIRSRNRVITVDNDSGKSYQTFLSLTKLPDTFEYPDCDWIYMLQQYKDINAEICLHIKIVEHREGVKKLDLKRREYNSQLEHIEAAAADIPEELLEGREYLNLMESELKSSKAPLLNTSITICLADKSKKELENKVSKVKNIYEDMNFGIERSISDQLSLYFQFIPSVGQVVKDFIMQLTPITLASGVIGASHQLGDNEGNYIGTTGTEEKQVYLNLGKACLVNKSASGIFLGNLGVGKSFNTNLLVYLTIMSGGYALIFDPKGERSHWEDELKVLDGLITTVTLSGEKKYKGKLDPYNIYDDIEQANELAINMLTELFGIKQTSKEYVAILEGIKHIQDGEKPPSMLKLASNLENFKKDDKLYEQADMLARRIRLQVNNGMAQLLFGDGTEKGINLENRLNILQIQNLKLPSPETQKEDYSTEEKMSTVVMMVLSHFAKKFALVKRPVFKLVLVDESWALSKTQEGVKMLDFLTRMGRSLFTGCILNGHSVLDIPTEGIKNTLTYKFCFQTKNDSEADRMIEFLGLENTRDLHDTLKNLGNGQCLFQDLEGRVGVLQFDAVFQDIIDVFSTTPTTSKEENEGIAEVLQEEQSKKDEVIDIYEREVV